MQCKCGQETHSQSHQVKTIAKAKDWLDTADEADLPLLINQDKCSGCGRIHYEIVNKDKELLLKHG